MVRAGDFIRRHLRKVFGLQDFALGHRKARIQLDLFFLFRRRFLALGLQQGFGCA